MSDKTTTPPGLSAAGKRLWLAVLSVYELDEHERGLLLVMCRTADRLDELDREVRREGVMVDSPQGRKANPALVEQRQQAIAYARLTAALRLPEGDELENARPQRRVGVRGTYGIRGVVRNEAS